MNHFISMIITLLLMFVIGFIGYIIFKALRMPAPALIGSLMMNAVVTSLGANWTEVHISVTMFLQITIGIMLGSQFNKEKVKRIGSLVIPGLLVAFWMLLVGMCLGHIISKTTGLDIGTALFGAAPGGMAEMGILAMAYNLDTPKVILFQFLRVVIIYFTIPIIAAYLHKDVSAATKEIICTKDMGGELSKEKQYNIIFTLLVGTIAGYLTWKIKIPAGAMIGSLIAIGGLRSYGVRLKVMPRKFIVCVQIGLGAFLGLTFTPSVAKTLSDMFGVSLIFTFITTINGFILGYIMHRIFKWDLITSLFACAPAGISQMGSIALEMDADITVVSVIQTIRLIAVVLILPPIIIRIMG